ncbi:type II toxin-antitoxin system antitoxin SocA domain-containing protein [Emticicia soli]|uniref:Type II toxin-antitoxin system antitoxin SocA domain-containing protein n=1 Tax=Emticicia soli TaxID=2027878 RepID=A0ABW5JBI5_9BACT
MKYIKSPFSDKNLQVRTRLEKILFRKEEFEIIYQYYEDKGQQFTTDEEDEINLKQVYNQYREKHRLPFPEEIQEIREKYQLSASKMSEVLGFGINIYRQYENGEVPNHSNARLIQLIKDPEEFKKLVQLSDVFSLKELEKIIKHIDTLILKGRHNQTQFIIEDYILENSEKPCSQNGYQKPNLQKVRQTILYLVTKLKPYKTALNKFLFYADFVHYRNYGKSLMGLRYRAIPLGTVPSNYNRILADTIERGIINVEYVNFPNGIGEKFNPGTEIELNLSLFSDKELNTLESVVEAFSGKKTNEIVDLNHQETAWIENQENRQIVDYKFAFELKYI